MGNQSPYFSIILPIYNVAPYLEYCIQSVLEQSFQDFELILVDDGSTDGSGSICDDYAARYDKIRVLHKSNGGLSSARNAGTELARGIYLWWVDSDDWIGQGALQRLFEATRDTGADMVKFGYYRCAEVSAPCRGIAAPGLYAREEELEALRDMAFLKPGSFSLSAWSHVYRRSFLQERELSFLSEREIGSEDYPFNLLSYLLAEKVCVLEELLYAYRLREGSLTQRYRKDLLRKYTELYRQLREAFRREGQLEKYDARICRFYVWHLIHGTCIANEYRNTESHSREEGRKNIRAFFRSPDLRYGVKHCDCRGLNGKQKLQLLAMAAGAEPLFYRLYVVKPRKKKGTHHEN